MELFARKTYTCERCGASFESRLGILTADYCKECVKEVRDIDRRTKGIRAYEKALMQRVLTEEEKDMLLQQTSGIYKKYRLSDKPGRIVRIKDSRSTVKDAAKKGNLLQGHKTSDFISAYNNGCRTRWFTAMLGKFKGVVIENSEVIAVSYGINRLSNGDGHVFNILALTTNPWFPVIPMSQLTRIRLFSNDKKTYLEMYSREFKKHYPNLRYPLMKNAELKKILKQSEITDCAASYSTIANCMRDAVCNSGVFKLPDSTYEMDKLQKEIRAYGYCSAENP